MLIGIISIAFNNIEIPTLQKLKNIFRKTIR